MSQQLVHQFLNDLDRIRKLSGSLNEQTIREAFKDLLKAWSRQAGLLFVAELEYASAQKTKVRGERVASQYAVPSLRVNIHLPSGPKRAAMSSAG
jgi:hypothetical protein